MVKVGLRASSFPTPEEFSILFEFVTTQYRDYTDEQINQAFDLAISGKLGIDPNPFENFSCLYFGRVMSAYQAYLINTGAVVKNTDKERRSIALKKEAEPSQPVIEYTWMDECKAIAAALAAQQQPKYIPIGVYTYLEDKKALKRGYEAFVEVAKSQVLAKLHTEKRDAHASGQSLNSILQDIDDVLNGGNTSAKIIVQAKKLAIIEALQP